MNDIEFYELLDNPDKMKEYTHSQMAMLGAKFKPLLNRDELAVWIGCSKTTAGCAKTEAKFAIPEVIDALESGRINFNDACTIRKLQLQGEQVHALHAILDKQVNKPKSRREQHKTSLNNGRVTRCLDQFNNSLDMLEEFLSGDDKRRYPDDYLQWLSAVYVGMKRLNQLIDKLMEGRSNHVR